MRLSATMRVGIIVVLITYARYRRTVPAQELDVGRVNVVLKVQWLQERAF